MAPSPPAPRPGCRCPHHSCPAAGPTRRPALGRRPRPVRLRARLGDDALDVGPQQHLLLEQRAGERVEQGPVGDDDLERSAPRHVGEALLLVVDEPARGVRDRVVVGGRRRDMSAVPIPYSAIIARLSS